MAAREKAANPANSIIAKVMHRTLRRGSLGRSAASLCILIAIGDGSPSGTRPIACFEEADAFGKA
jgi:hypothetical protein